MAHQQAEALVLVSIPATSATGTCETLHARSIMSGVERQADQNAAVPSALPQDGELVMGSVKNGEFILADHLFFRTLSSGHRATR